MAAVDSNVTHRDAHRMSRVVVAVIVVLVAGLLVASGAVGYGLFELVRRIR